MSREGSPSSDVNQASIESSSPEFAQNCDPKSKSLEGFGQFRRLIWVPRAVADVGGGLEVEGQAAEAEAPEAAGRSQA